MKAKFYFTGLFAAMMISATAYAETATSVMNNMINVFQKNSIQTNFGLIVKQANSNSLHKMNGTFLMNGNKFTLNTDEMQVYFDGKTQWTYMPELNEVSITNPTEKELVETNPMALLQSYQNKSAIRFAAKSSSKTTYSVELTPKAKDSEFKKIIVIVGKSNYYPQTIQVTDKKGMISTLALSQFKTGVRTNADSFVFITKNYKDIEINDLR